MPHTQKPPRLPKKKLASFSPYFKGILFAMGTAASWSVLAILLKLTLKKVDPYTLSCVRLLGSALVLLLYASLFRRGELKNLGLVPRIALIAGGCLAANYIGYLKGIHLSTAGFAQVLIQLSPTFLVVGGFVFFKEKPTGRQILGLVMGLIGFAVFFQDQTNFALQTTTLRDATLWLFFGSVTWAAFALIQKSLYKSWTSLQLNLTFFLSAGFLLLPLAQLQQIAIWPASTWALVLFATLNTLVAYGCFSAALQRIPSATVSLIISVNPIGTLILMETLVPLIVPSLNREHVGFYGWLGALLVVSGVMQAFWKKELKSESS